MPDKSVREMSSLERMHHSLAARTFRSVVRGCLILGLVTLVIGLSLYALALTDKYTTEAFNISRSALSVMEKVSDPVTLCNDVMETYYGLTKSQKQMEGTEAYRRIFRGYTEREDYRQIRDLLDDFRTVNDVYDVYLAMYDASSASIVYVVDPDDDPEFHCEPGDREDVNEKEMNRFLLWNGEGKLYSIDRTNRYGWLCSAAVPVKDASGQTVGFVLTDVTIAEMNEPLKRFILQYLVAVALVMLGFGHLMTRHMKKKLVDPINEITGAAESYVADRVRGDGEGEHFSRLDIHTGDEIENLSLVMADMEEDLKKYEADLTRVASEKERIVTELNLARRIQSAMLPGIFPPFPERNEFDLYAIMTPAKEVGGDFYDFFLLDDDHLCLVMADVSGKGIPAALFMMVSRILIKNQMSVPFSPGAALEKVNHSISRNNPEEMFVTAWVGVLEISTGKITAANAGHEYPVIMRPDGGYELLKDRHGFVVGGIDGVRYTEYEISLEPGSRLFLYTDGVPEATDGEGKLFGTDRMLEALNGVRAATPKDVLDGMSAALDGYVGEAERFDDVTMLCLSYYGTDEMEGGNGVEREFEARIENIPAVTEFVDGELEKAGCPLKAQMQLDVIVDELFCNISSYAYEPGVGKAKVRVDTETEPGSAILTFTDSGIPFDPLQAVEPDVTLPAEQRDVGGLGIFLVRKTMDDISYEYRDGKNILTVKKNF